MKKPIQYIFLSLLFVGCSQDFLDKQPLDVASTSSYWKNEADVKQAVTGVYTFLKNLDNDIFMATTTDDAYCVTTWPIDIPGAANGTATASTGVFQHYWQNSYQAIAAANNVLDNADKVTNMDETMRSRYKAEARFIRAFFYQRLTGLYGDVPLITTMPAQEDLKVTRTPKTEVVAFIISELEAIEADLPETYEGTDMGRVTKGAALALKARILLYEERWTEAAAAAKEVMDLNVYAIENQGLLSLFNGTNKNSEEIIFSARYLEGVSAQKNGVATWTTGPSLGGWSNIAPLQPLVDAFECTDGKTITESTLYDATKPFANRDPRLALTVVLPGAVVNGITVDVTIPTSIDRPGSGGGSVSGYYFRKYVPSTISGQWYDNSYNDEVLIRYAEVLLTYAEAKIEAGDVDATVFAALNQIRQRQGVAMPAVTAAMYATQLAQRTLVRRERRVELALEPFRLYDIRRWKIAETVMPGKAIGILNYFDRSRADFGQNILVETRSFSAGRDYLWPIPQSDLDINGNLRQNANW
jgi:hypothetical protein